MTPVQQIQKLICAKPDNDFGPKSQIALKAACAGTISSVQEVLKVTQTGLWDVASESALEALLHPLPVWKYQVARDGDDLIITTPVTITTFGGDGRGNCPDPQDDGRCAAPGRNTKNQILYGVALAMDSRQFPGMQQRDPAGYQALLGAPFPRMPYGTLIQIKVGNVVYLAKDGLLDLGPGHNASKTATTPQEAHGCDLTLPLANLIMPGHSMKWLANNFEVQGTVRALGVGHLLA